MRHLSTLLLFLSCVIYVIQSSDPAPQPHAPHTPEPHPAPHTPEPHPAPHTPEPHPAPHTPLPHPAPHTPEPHTPQPHAPQPHPTPEPHPHPAPHPEPQPHTPEPPHPQPGPPIPSVDDFYIEQLATAHNFDGISHGAVALTGNNDTISIFGGLLVNGSVADYVLQYTISTGVFVNVSYWNPMHHVISYSQAPTDAINNYGQNPLYYLLKNMTEYSVWSYDGVTHQKTFNVSFKTDEVGQQIAAVPGGGIYVYGSESGLWWWDGKQLNYLNVTGGPVGRSWPALVAYNGDLYLHGGSYTSGNTSIIYGDFWYYSSAAKDWSPRNNGGIPPSSGHTATLSVSKTTNYNSANIYFSGLSTGTLVNYDIGANSSSTIMGTDLPSESVATINGNRMFIFGGKLGVAGVPQKTLYQIVNEKYCTGISDCETCVSVPSCTWCKVAVSTTAPSCVSGSSTNPWILKTCSGTSNTTSGTAVISMVEYCPEIFPSWAIALIVIGGVILVGGIVFGIMKLRSGKPGYEPV